MKKVILSITALVMVLSGVAAVSAYEAHIINVKAHVENALTVNTLEVDFGTVFPQEWLKQHRNVSLSTSAIAELGIEVGDLESVTLQPFAEWKADVSQEAYYWDAVGSVWVLYEGYFNWMGDFLWVGFDASQDPVPTTGMTKVGPADAPPLSAQEILTTVTLDTVTRTTQLAIAIDVPVFEGYYNVLTDPTPKPSGMDVPSLIIPADRPDFDPTGMDFGIDLKIQVIDIARVLPQ